MTMDSYIESLKNPAGKNYYEILELKEDATLKEIDDIYKKLIFEYHPDHFKEPCAEEVSKLLNEIHETFKNKENRDAYDKNLKAERLKEKGKEAQVRVYTYPYSQSYSEGWKRERKKNSYQGYSQSYSQGKTYNYDYSQDYSEKRRSYQEYSSKKEKTQFDEYGVKSQHINNSWSNWIANVLIILFLLYILNIIYNQLPNLYYYITDSHYTYLIIYAFFILFSILFVIVTLLEGLTHAIDLTKEIVIIICKSMYYAIKYIYKFICGIVPPIIKIIVEIRNLLSTLILWFAKKIIALIHKLMKR